MPRARLREALRRLRDDHGKCIVFSTHVMPEVQRLCDRVLVMAQGRAVAEGTVAELCALTGHDDFEQSFVQLAFGADAQARGVASVKAAWIVFRKELLDALRDRRTLLMVLLSSVAMGPLVLVLLSSLVSGIEQRAETREVFVAGIEHAPTLRNYLERQTYRVREAPADYEATGAQQPAGRARARHRRRTSKPSWRVASRRVCCWWAARPTRAPRPGRRGWRGCCRGLRRSRRRCGWPGAACPPQRCKPSTWMSATWPVRRREPPMGRAGAVLRAHGRALRRAARRTGHDGRRA